MPTDDRADDRRLMTLALLGSMMMAAPLWIGRFLPLLDLPQHLAITTVLLRHADPAWQLGAYFEPQRGELTPYWAHYLALEGLGRLMPLEVAARVFLTLYVFALPWAAMALARALGRPPAAGLFAIPLALNGNLYYGFIAFCGSVVALLWAIALLSRQLDSPRGSRAAGLALLSVALFFMHVQSFAFLLLAAGLLVRGGGALRQTDSGSRAAVALVTAAPVWTRVLRAWPLAPATLAVFLPWLYLSTTDRPGAERYFPPLDASRASYGAPLPRLASVPSAIAGSFQDGTDTWLLAAWGVAVAAALPWSRRERDGTSTRGAAALAAGALACYFVLPLSIQGQWNIAQRFAWITALLIPLLIRRAPCWLPGAVLALSAVTAANAGWHHVLFDREVGPFDRALAVIHPGARVLGLMHDPRGKVLERWPYLHFEQYAVVRGGGVAAHSFTANAPLPVRLRPEARVPVPGVWVPRDFRYDEHGPFFDHFLVRDPTGTRGLRRPHGSGVYEVFREGAWRVYRGRSRRTLEDES